MGMYDHIRFKKSPLPGVEANAWYQTKSLACELAFFEVDEGGRFFEIDRSLQSGTHHPPMPLQFTGGVDFHGDSDIAYCALFDSGSMILIRVLPEDRYGRPAP